jgi:hypothetical protein
MEKMLKEMRESATAMPYPVGTPRGRLGKLEQDSLTPFKQDIGSSGNRKLAAAL